MSRTFKYLGLIFLGSFGTIVLKKFSKFTIANELDSLSIVSIFLTVLMAIYFGVILEKRQEDDRTKRDKLIDFFEKLDLEVKEIVEEILKRSSLEITRNTMTFKRLRMKLSELIAVSKSSIKLRDDTQYNEIQNKVENLWRYCTDEDSFDEDLIRLELMRIEIQIYKLILMINNS